MNENEQKSLNILRKSALNLLKFYQMQIEPKRALSAIMFDCLLDPYFMLKLIPQGEQ